MEINEKHSRGIPFKSKLRPYVDQIRKWRRAGFTWAGIADKLGEQGCATCATNLYQFMRRYRRRPHPSGAGDQRARSSHHKTREENEIGDFEGLFHALLRAACRRSARSGTSDSSAPGLQRGEADTPSLDPACHNL